MKYFLRFVFLVALLLVASKASAQSTPREVAGWYNDGWNADSHSVYLQHDTLFTEVNPYWYDLGTDANPGATNGSMTERAYAYSAQMVLDVHARGDLVIPSMADRASGQINTIVSNATSRAALVANIVQTVQNRNYDGFDLNFESGAPSGRVAFTTFVTDLANALHANGKRLSVTVKSVPNRTEENWYIFDLAGLGASPADRFKVMAYDKNFDAGANVPGPIAPINWVRNCLTYMIGRGLLSTRVQLGLHNYAWTWSKAKKATTWTLNYPFDTYQGVLVKCPGISFSWNANAQESWVTCVSGTTTYKSFVGDSNTVMSRVPLADEFDLAGVAFWVLGHEDPMIYTEMCAYYGTC